MPHDNTGHAHDGASAASPVPTPGAPSARAATGPGVGTAHGPVRSSLRQIELDALREIANIGAGHAATALSEATGGTIMIDVPAIRVASIDELAARVSPHNEPVAGVMIHMLGDLSGRTLLACPTSTVTRLAELMLTHRAAAPVAPRLAASGDTAGAAITEAGSILSGAYLNALSDFLGLLLLPSPPTLVADMSAAVLTTALREFAPDPDAVLCVESEFRFRESDLTLRGYFFLLPDPASLQVMLRALRLA